MTNLEKLTDQVQKFCEARDWDQFHTPKELAIGMVTEAGELLQHFRFLDPQQAQQLLEDPPSREKIGEELADVMFFILRFAQMNQFDLQRELKNKIQKNAAKYPVEEFRGRNNKSTRV